MLFSCNPHDLPVWLQDMAQIVALKPPYRDPNGNVTDQFLNVSGKVGPHADCTNNAADVSLVQSLIKMCTPVYRANHHFPPPEATGKLDPITGFYIFEIQWRMKQREPNTVVDGCVSPASTGGYGGGTWFTIVQLNIAAHKSDPAGWKALFGKYAVAHK